MPGIAVIGTTTWGATLGTVWARNGHQVRLWAWTDEEADRIRAAGPAPDFQPEVRFPRRLTVTSSLDEALRDADAVVIAVPSQTMRDNVRRIAGHLDASVLVISASKGIEIGTHYRMTQVIAEEVDAAIRPNIGVLSGPNLSREIIRGLPAATVVAAESEATCHAAQKLLTTPALCVYRNSDIIGVELGGALKNIIALAAGVVDGLDYGDNAKATLVTRGLAEITALGVALGANPLTFAGLAGLGDLMVTCASPLSRNHHVGVELARGRPLDEITATMTGVAEGISTTRATWEIAHELGLEMPITEQMYRVLNEEIDPEKAAVELMGTQARHELAGRRWKLFSLFRERGRPRSRKSTG